VFIEPFSRPARLARAFASDRRGNVALIFALCLIPILVVIGAAVDLGNAQRMRAQLQDATDSAVLAVARDGLRLSDAQLKPQADSYLKASYRYLKQAPYTITKLTFDRTSVTAVLDTKASAPTSFMQIVGITSLPITAHAVSKGLGFEVAMVLDTSGSMSDPAGSGGSKISALRTAASSFLDSMFGNQATSQRVSVGIVPFAATVRVLPAGSSPPNWLDTSGATPYASEDFDSNSAHAWQLFGKLKNTKWGGCVMTRQSPYDVDDTVPSGATQFAPWFAPDEPDSGYHNSYLTDTGGSCGWSWFLSDATRQARTCKYNGATPNTYGGKGPNYLCDSNAITPLTNTKATLSDAVDALQADGNTNILEGVMWGWRVLSPTAPFTEGKAYNSANNRKIIILMTDGQNNYGGLSNMNYSEFFTYGYAVHGHIGQKTSNNSTLTSLLDAKTLTACTNAKAKGIVIYTIGFGSGAKASQALLSSCASEPDFFFQPQNSSDLKPVFLAIAESINRLRIAE
jgi:Flp pilus assembly protein TadG